MTFRNYNAAIESSKHLFGDTHQKLEARYRKLLSLERKTERYQDMKAFLII